MRSLFSAEHLRFAKRRWVPRHPDSARSLKNLAAVCYGWKRYAESSRLPKGAGHSGKESGNSTPGVAASLQNYAETLRKLKRQEEAVEVDGRVKALLAD